jgi:hypothetical protein
MKKSIIALVFLALSLTLFTCQEDPTSSLPEDKDTPIANAGPDKMIYAGQYLEIDGSSSLKNSGDTLIYNWSEKHGNPYVNIIGMMAKASKFISIYPYEGKYIYYLKVDNGKKESQLDSLIITVLPRTTILFIDPFLEIAVRFGINKPNGEINENDLLSISALSVFQPVTNYSGIEKCKNITNLELWTSTTADFSNLAMLDKLRSVNLHSFSGFKSHQQSIYPIINNPSLDALIIMHASLNNIIIDNISNLKSLIIYFCNLPSTGFLNKCSSITHLDLEGTKITNFILPPELVQLEHLDIQQQGITSLPTIPSLIPIKRIIATLNKITNLNQLSNCNKLTDIYLDFNNIEDISPLANVINLEIVTLNGNQIKDISPLLGLAKLKEVRLSSAYLNEKSLNEHVPALRAKGVVVILN